jgi:pimeloyl-ACP methyl ester carboxylesterase
MATMSLPDGRTVGYADYGTSDQTAVLWCHGGPGSRLEPEALAPAARAAGLRIVGIDRPGYGDSTPVPGRTIGQWVPDALALADHLGIEHFATVGVSTGGAYALALAADESQRAIGAIACCALTDMRSAELKSLTTRNNPAITEIWGARDRAHALAIATEAMGADGTKMMSQAGAGPALAESDMALLGNPEWLAGFLSSLPLMFAHGVQGYADDRLADGPGWGSFDVTRVRCPVIVLHGGSDSICPVALAHHTAKIVPGAKLVIHDSLGHFSIMTEVLPALRELLGGR